MLYIYDNGKKIFSTKVCTGSKRSAYFQERMKVYKKTKRWRDKPDDWETPNMYGEISYMVLNPTWSVPPSIMREEIAYKLKKDSTYLVDKNFKVFKDGVEIDSLELTVDELHSDKIPYRIVQDPGAGNALGKIRFMLNNPFGIYLHDTPNRPPFNQSNRAVSHGCVRVEKPLPLAEFLLRNDPSWNINYLKIEIGQKLEDKSIVSEYCLIPDFLTLIFLARFAKQLRGPGMPMPTKAGGHGRPQGTPRSWEDHTDHRQHVPSE